MDVRWHARFARGPQTTRSAGPGWWSGTDLSADVRQSLRSLAHSPSFAVVALLTLTFSIGLSTAVFSLVDAVVVQPLPHTQPERLVRLAEFQPGVDEPATGGTLRDRTIGIWLQRHQVVEALAPYAVYDNLVTTPAGPSNAIYSPVGMAFFKVVDTRPIAGRLLQPFDWADRATMVAVISERFWASAFGKAGDAVGRTIVLDERPRVVVGVLPRSFTFPSPDVDIWVPDPTTWAVGFASGTGRLGRNARTIARLREGASVEDAEREGASVARAVATSDPNFADGTVEVSRIRVRRLLDDLVAPVRPALLALGAGMALVLIAACFSLANLLLARHTARQQDLSVRLALGATAWRVLRPILLEQLFLAGGGGLLGGILAWWILGALPELAPAELPRLESVRFDVASLAFAILASLATAASVAALPAWQMRKGDLRELTSSGRVRLGRSAHSADSLRALLVTVQIALAVVLLVGAFLVGRSLLSLLKLNPGYHSDGVLTFQVDIPISLRRRDGFARRYYTELLERLRLHPAVASAGYAMALPLRKVGIRTSVRIVGKPVTPARSMSDMAISQTIDGEYLRTVGTRVLRGRGFTPQDTPESQKIVLVDEVLARKYFPNEDPVGRQIVVRRNEHWTIVGVVEAVRAAGLMADADPVIYYYTRQITSDSLAYFPTGAGIAVRVTGDPLGIVPFVREQARQVDPTLPLYNIARLSDQLSQTVAQPRFFALVLGLFAALALSTAMLGIYGVLAYAVERRRLEFGIRRALGATERHVAALVLGRALMLAGSGIAVGLAGGALATRFMRALLFGVRPADPLSFGGAAVLVIAIVLVASWLPTRRASRIDAALALRVE